jgi:hypothetical protein
MDIRQKRCAARCDRTNGHPANDEETAEAWHSGGEMGQTNLAESADDSEEARTSARGDAKRARWKAAPMRQSASLGLHAGVRCAAKERKKFERLCRCITRPALANDRVQVNEAGQNGAEAENVVGMKTYLLACKLVRN